MIQNAGLTAIVAAIAVVSTLYGLSLACPGPVTSFSGRKTLSVNYGARGVLLRDQLPSPDNDDKVWYLPTYTDSTIQEYRTMDDFAAGNVPTTYRLPRHAGSGGMATWGFGHIIYNNSLYYQRFPDCMSYSYDCDKEKAILVRYDFSLQAYTAVQSLPTAHLSHWGVGPTFVFLAVDGGSVWAISIDKERVYHLSKLNAHDLSIEEIINTEYTVPSSNWPPFIACGKFYSMVRDRVGARTDLIFDLYTKQKDTTTQALYCVPWSRFGRFYFSFNSRENKVYALESYDQVSYDVTIGDSFVIDSAMLNCTT